MYIVTDADGWLVMFYPAWSVYWGIYLPSTVCMNQGLAYGCYDLEVR